MILNGRDRMNHLKNGTLPFFHQGNFAVALRAENWPHTGNSGVLRATTMPSIVGGRIRTKVIRQLPGKGIMSVR